MGSKDDMLTAVVDPTVEHDDVLPDNTDIFLKHDIVKHYVDHHQDTIALTDLSSPTSTTPSTASVTSPPFPMPSSASSTSPSRMISPSPSRPRCP